MSDTIFEYINLIVTTVNHYLWGYILVLVLVLISIYFTIRMKFAQISFLSHSIKLLFANSPNKTKKQLSSLQVFCTSLASIIGTGSVAGMGIAISIGGPGSIFWMWIISLATMATSFIEHTLGQIYKVKDAKGRYVGGPAYYIIAGLNNKFVALVFSIIIVIAYALIFNGIQSHTVASSLHQAFDFNPHIVGLVFTALMAIFVLTSNKVIAKAATFLVPLKAIIFLLLGIAVIIINIDKMPSIFTTIITSAFTLKAGITGGISGLFLQVILTGIKRALFSTEAGAGSAPNITASAQVSHPAIQGFVGMLGGFFTSFIVCTITAIIILSQDIYLTSHLEGIALVQESLKLSLGNIAVYVMTLIVLILGFTTAIGNYSYAEHNFSLLINKKYALIILRISTIVLVFIGSIADLHTVWNLADLFMGVMIIINSWAIFKLRKVALACFRNYKQQLKTKSQPIFHKESIPELKNHKDNSW